MIFYTIRVDIAPNGTAYSEVKELSKIMSEKLIEFFGSSKKWGDYYWVLEQSDKEMKWHLQGWIESSYASGTIASNKSNPFRPYVKSLLTFGDYSMAPIKESTYYGYIYKNPNKSTPDMVWNSCTSEFLNSISVHLKKDEFVAQEYLKKTKKISWSDRVLLNMEERCVTTNIVGERVIQYHLLEHQMVGLPKNCGGAIYRNNLQGLTKRLEEKFPNPYNRRVESYFRRLIREDTDLDLIFNTDQNDRTYHKLSQIS